MTEKIFMSYAHQDRRYAKIVERALRQQGILVTDDVIFLDPHEHLKAGADFRKEIRAQITAATKVVVVATANAESSEWVNYEVGMADALGKPIVVVGRKGMGKSARFSKLSGVRSIEIPGEE
jgi:CheY-like chemotaxis protein